MRKAKYIALALMVISGTAIAGPLKSHSALDSMMRIYEKWMGKIATPFPSHSQPEPLPNPLDTLAILSL